MNGFPWLINIKAFTLNPYGGYVFMSKKRRLKQYVYRKLGIRMKREYETKREYEFVESEVTKDFDEENNSLRYVKSDIFRDKNDERGELINDYGTRTFEFDIDYDEAIKDSISFKVDTDDYVGCMRHCPSVHVDFVNLEENTHTGVTKYEFEDGSFFRTSVTYTKTYSDLKYRGQ